MSRQEKVVLASRKVEQKDQTQAKSEENFSSTKKLDGSKPEFKNMEFSKNHRYMVKIFKCLQKKLGWSALDSTFSLEAHKTNVLI